MKYINVRDILFITLTNTGDGILTTPVLDVLFRTFGGAVADVVASPLTRGLFCGDPLVREVITYDKRASLGKRWKMISQLRKRRYDLVVDLRDSVIPFIIRKRMVIGVNFPSDRSGGMHMKDRHLSKLRKAGIDVSGADFRLCIDHKSKFCADKLLMPLNGRRFLTVNPSAKNHLKMWDTGNFAILCDRLIDEFDADIVIIGDRPGFETGQRLIQRTANPGRILNLSGMTSLSEAAEVIGRSSMLVTNDSAPLHMGSAVGTPVLAIFGPTNPVKYGPLSEKSKAVTAEISCRPCEKGDCTGSHECMYSVSVDKVFEAALDIMKKVW